MAHCLLAPKQGQVLRKAGKKDQSEVISSTVLRVEGVLGRDSQLW